MNAIRALPNYHEIDKRIRERFDVMHDFTEAALEGDIRAMIVSGPAGLGKSFTVERALKGWDPGLENYIIIKGFVKTTGLIKMLYQHRFENHAVIFDDADTLFFDDDSMNILKTVCDTCEERWVSYLSEYKLEAEDGDIIPSRFEFKGSVIFLTNLDFDKMIEKGNKVAPHLQALVSRSHYIDLTLKSRDDYLVRIEQVVDEGMLNHLPKSQQNEILNFVIKHVDTLRELSLRMVIKLAGIRTMKQTHDWEAIARVTCCRN